MGHTYRENLYLNRKERLGLIMLFIILFCFLFIPHLWNTYFKSSLTTRAEQVTTHLIPSSQQDIITKNPSLKSPLKNKVNATTKPNLPYEFDPNKIQLSDAQKLGIPKHAFNNLSKYRNKGGTIKSANDLNKIFGMPHELVESLTPYMVFPKKSKTPDTISYSKPFETHHPVIDKMNINTATVEELIPLPGIALKLSERIIKYRNSIGGFHDINQLKEVYGLPDSTFKKISPYLFCDGIYTKIKINAIDAEDLSEHPFFTKKQAQFIINFRLQHESISSIEDLKNTNYFTNEWLDKINKYLDYTKE